MTKLPAGAPDSARSRVDHGKVRRAHDRLFSVMYSGFHYGELAAFHGIPGHGRTIARRHAAIRRRVECRPINAARGWPQAHVAQCTTKSALIRKAVALARLEVKYGREYANIAEAEIRSLSKGHGPVSAEADEWNYEELRMAAEECIREHRAAETVGEQRGAEMTSEQRAALTTSEHCGAETNGEYAYALAA